MTKTQSGNKRVESSLVACLDPSSILGDSTKILPLAGFLFLEAELRTALHSSSRYPRYTVAAPIGAKKYALLPIIKKATQTEWLFCLFLCYLFIEKWALNCLLVACSK